MKHVAAGHEATNSKKTNNSQSFPNEHKTTCRFPFWPPLISFALLGL